MNIPFVKKNEIYSFVDKNFVYLVASCVVIVVFLFTYFLIVPTWKDIRDVSVLELEQKQQRLNEMQKFLSQLKTMRDSYAAIDYNDIQRLETVLPKGFDKQQLFLQLQELVSQNGLTATSITINEHLATATSNSRRNATQGASASTGESGGVEEVGVVVVVRGLNSYDSFKTFMSSLQTFAPLVIVSSIDYPVSSSAFTLNLKTYYLSES